MILVFIFKERQEHFTLL